jgi:hypothetical protein
MVSGPGALRQMLSPHSMLSADIAIAKEPIAGAANHAWASKNNLKMTILFRPTAVGPVGWPAMKAVDNPWPLPAWRLTS